MVKTLTKHGNSRAIVIEKAILDLLKIGDETLLEVTTDGTRLIIAPMDGAGRKERLQRSIDRVHEQYGPALSKLAK